MIAARLFWVDLVCFGVQFGLVDLYDVAFDSILQAITPNQLLGRVVTFTSVVAIFSVPLSTIVGGLVIDQVKNVLLVFGVLGAFLIFLALVFVRSPLSKRPPVGRKATDATPSRCPCRMWRHCHVFLSQSRIVVSWLALAMW